MTIPVTVVVEGPTTDVAVAGRILKAVGCSVDIIYGRSGKGTIMRNLGGYNKAAQFAPWFVLRDLDHDASCAPALVSSTLQGPAKWMRYRIAVRGVEAWLLADPEALAGFLRVRRELMPQDPDGLSNPKAAVVSLARKSRSSQIRRDVVPASGTSALVGPAYSSRMAEFVSDHWRPDVARNRSDSLRRCLDRVRELASYSTGTTGRSVR